eukprot:1510306-Alexandrium_andersonii.AAC.1
MGARSQLAKRANRPSPRLGICRNPEPPRCRAGCRRRRAPRGASSVQLWLGSWDRDLPWRVGGKTSNIV